MNHEYILWVMVVAYAMHIVEEHNLDWQGWVKRNANFDVPLADFYVVNAALIVGMMATAMIGWQLPELSLAPAALMFINGLFFHIGASLVKRQYSPGAFTSLVLFLPIAAWTYCGAYLDGVLTTSVALWSIVLGVLLMAFPLALWRMKSALRLS
jgi:hypothetical protein